MTDAPVPVQLTLSGLFNMIDVYLREYPDTANMRVALAKDPEGNGFAFISPDGLFSEGAAESVYGSARHLEGVPVVVLWPGYPQFEDVQSPEDDDDD